MKLNLWRASGICMLVCGLGMGAFGGIVMVRASGVTSRAAEIKSQMDQQCRSQLAAIPNAKVTVTPGGELDVLIKGVTDSRVSLADATSAIGDCPGRTMDRFCMGADCVPGSKPGNISMTFSLIVH